MLQSPAKSHPVQSVIHIPTEWLRDLWYTSIYARKSESCITCGVGDARTKTRDGTERATLKLHD